ncbi:MAG: hypothetical protein MN733_16940 [Nitrososphaera sp.]|nr:hypothetical protein [Nitrososphaera sp.]
MFVGQPGPLYRAISLVLFLSLSPFGCAFRGPSDISGLAEEYKTLRGTLVAPPVLENGSERLVLYVREEKPTEDKQEVLICVAVNKENKRLLKEMVDKLAAVDAPIFLYGKPIEGNWYEYIEGIDFEVVAVGYYSKDADKYVTVITIYGDGAMDVIRSAGWRRFLIEVSKKAVKAAI